ncbi:MAG: hypothetical protein COV70_02050 [Parcubacteria group bacterium CG11_big_fil_rev_8_21_14_0_20_39_22]|nr:MAG: hypothetical protein COV70_02050 [Parcubacteria group bacterium CG11_big_fil_rev_8_21_14_0_20_39_22]
MQPKFVEFNTKDGLTLPGLLYGGKDDKSVVIYLHGNGSTSVFYSNSKNQILADVLSKKNISVLYFNNRGAHIIKRMRVKGKKEKQNFGMAYEKIKECIFDIDSAVTFLKKQGYKKIYLAGASTGANKICVYNFYNPKNSIEKYILLCGGDDVGIYYKMLGKARFNKILTEAKKKIKAGQGEDIVKEMLPEAVFSHTGFYDMANPDGDYNIFPFVEVLFGVNLSTKPLFRHFKSIKKPSLVVYGSEDEYAFGNVPKLVEILKTHQPDFDYKIIRGADHGFAGKEKKLAKIITDWI